MDTVNDSASNGPRYQLSAIVCSKHVNTDLTADEVFNMSPYSVQSVISEMSDYDGVWLIRGQTVS